MSSVSCWQVLLWKLTCAAGWAGGADKAAQDTHRELIVCEACLGRSFMCQLASFARKFRKGEGGRHDFAFREHTHTDTRT